MELLELTRQLVERPSITPDDYGCQDILVQHLAPLGFQCEFLESGGVRNLWARLGTQSPVFAFAGHTDVVPVGDEKAWSNPPFKLHEHDGLLYGRGVADMKGSLAAMIKATERFCSESSQFKGSIAFLITSDEEGVATDGTVKVMQMLEQRGERIDWCLVGEPSSSTQLGDCVRVGRRGSLNFELVVHGVQGHVAYPDKVDNPIHKTGAFIDVMSKTEWDKGNAFFPATSFQFSNIHAGTGATNVVPASVHLLGNFRFSTESTREQLQQRTEALLRALGIQFTLVWQLSGEPFLTQGGKLIEATQVAIKKVCGIETELSTGGGTSDGRFIAPYGVEVLELGPENSSIHKVDEVLKLSSLEKLESCYFEILRQLFSAQ